MLPAGVVDLPRALETEGPFLRWAHTPQTTKDPAPGLACQGPSIIQIEYRYESLQPHRAGEIRQEEFIGALLVGWHRIWSDLDR